MLLKAKSSMKGHNMLISKQISVTNKDFRFFKPWKGDFYGNEKSILSQKMLIVGASHYCEHFTECSECGIVAKDESCHDFTIDVVDKYLNDDIRSGWMKTFTTFVNSVFGYTVNSGDLYKFFQSIVFVNYLQKAEGNSGQVKNTGWLYNKQNADAFKQTITEFIPDVVIIWGARVWNALPWSDLSIDTTIQSSENIKRCNLRGITFILIKVHHPSVGYSRNVHHLLFKQNGISIV